MGAAGGPRLPPGTGVAGQSAETNKQKPAALILEEVSNRNRRKIRWLAGLRILFINQAPEEEIEW
jgi:hypothetical protein